MVDGGEIRENALRADKVTDPMRRRIHGITAACCDSDTFERPVVETRSGPSVDWFPTWNGSFMEILCMHVNATVTTALS